LEPAQEEHLGFVNVPAELGAIGTELDIDTGGETRTARVVPTPFVESKKAI
jgi:glycine cleavage system aminomethyltransferase T